MEFTRRDIGILAGFSLLLTVGVVLFINSQRGPTVEEVERPTERRSAGEPRPAEAPTEREMPGETPDFLRSAQAPATVPVGYQAIVERKLFEPLVEPAKPAARGGGVSPRDIPPPALNLPPLPPPALQERAVTPPAEKPAEKPAERPSAPPAPPKPTIVVTGLMRFGDGYRVLVENPERKQSRTVKVGEEAFGYRITEVDEEAGAVTVAAAEGPSNDVQLKLGDKPKVEEKQEAKPEATSGGNSSESNQRASGSGGEAPTASSGRRGFDPNNLTPEQRQRYEEWQRRRGGGRRGG